MTQFHHEPMLFSLFLLLTCLAIQISGQQNTDENGIPFLGAKLGIQKIVQPIFPNVPLVRAISESWFEQKLNHFDPFNSINWRQRYFTNNNFFNNKTRDGPVFVMIGGEESIDDGFISGGMWIEWAKKYSALCFQVEHRYYGKSYPTADVSSSNLKYLSSEQALADLANFISYQKKAMNLTKNKWIVFGGSYPGNLAAWFRLKYPHLAYGAVASSALILAKMNYKEYYEVLSNALKTTKQGSACTNAIQQGINAVVQMTKSTSTCGNIQKLFKLCYPIDCTDELQVSYAFETLAYSLFAVNVQNNNIPNWPGPNIDKLCNIMTNSSIGPPVNRLAAIGDIMMKLSQISCVYNNYYGVVNYYSTSTAWTDSAVTAGTRQWFYQTCTELGYFITSDSTNQPFGNRFPLSFILREQCTDVFGPNFNGQFVSQAIDWTNFVDGGLDLTLSRTVFVSGSIDPLSALGMTTNKTGNLAIFINGTSHCADMYPTSSKDSPALKAAKLQIEAVLKSWIFKN